MDEVLFMNPPLSSVMLCSSSCFPLSQQKEGYIHHSDTADTHRQTLKLEEYTRRR